jgi:hypothetical protein
VEIKKKEQKEMKAEQHLVLDDSLRNLYCTLRKVGAQLLAVRFIYRGRQWEADTPEEAIKLRRDLEANDANEPGADVRAEQEMRATGVWTPDTFWNFVQIIKPKQKAAVIALCENGHLWSHHLAAAIEVDEDALGGVLAGLSKQLRQLELRPSDLYQVHVDWTGGERKRLFQLQPSFLLTAKEVGWLEGSRDAASTKTKRKH